MKPRMPKVLKDRMIQKARKLIAGIHERMATSSAEEFPGWREKLREIEGHLWRLEASEDDSVQRKNFDA